MRTLILTLIGPDRPGLVEKVAATVADHGGNWLESRMAHLGGQFAGILRVSVAAANEEDLCQRLAALEEDGLAVVARGEDAPTPGGAMKQLILTLLGPDQPGIVSSVSRVLAGRSVNVEEIATGTESAPMSGETLFRVTALLGASVELDKSELQQAVEKLGAGWIVDVAEKEN